MKTRTYVACEECGCRMPVPRTSFYVYREGKCPSCGTWMEAEFEDCKLKSGLNVVDVPNQKEMP